MNNGTLALSIDDFTSGRFNQVAQFIRENWPYGNRPSGNETLEILAKSLGYHDYSEAMSSATSVPPPMFTLFHNISENFGRLGLAPKDEHRSDSVTSLDRIAIAFRGDTFGAKFVETWPVSLVGRWNFDGKPCTFDNELLARAENCFVQYLTRTTPMGMAPNGRRKNTHSTAFLVAGLYQNLTLNELSAKSIGDLIDAEAAEALLQDVMPIVLGEILCVNIDQANKIIHTTGMSMADVWALPRSEAGFPNLYARMRACMPAILERKAVELYIAPRKKNGYYLFSEGESYQQPDMATQVDEGSFSFSVQRDEIESPLFKTYSWLGQLKEPCGRVVAQIDGTYIAGLARQDLPAFDLISALDEMGDANVEVVDFVLERLQEEEFQDMRVGIPRGDLNTNLIFDDANLVTILRWERHEDSKPGIGASLLRYCLGELKRKYKRNMHIACSVQPYQYYRGAEMLASVREQRDQDIDKICKSITRVAERCNVVRVFLKGHVFAEPDSTFQRYCGEHYQRHV